jgi:pimeloyl-ACP methyl ester carboxylesterase
MKGFRFVTFNYRGAAGSEGTPGEKYFFSDIEAMVGCAHAESLIFIGHGTGAIAAYNSLASGLGKGAILVDPAESFRSALSARYRIFFPEFLSRTRAEMNFENSETPIPIVILDDPRRGEVVCNLLNRHSEKFVQVERKGRSLIDVLQDELFKMKTN